LFSSVPVPAAATRRREGCGGAAEGLRRGCGSASCGEEGARLNFCRRAPMELGLGSSRYLPCSFEAEFQGQSVWIYGTSLRRRAVRDEAAAPRRRQLSGTVPRGATPHTDGAVRPSRSISQSTEHRILEVYLPLCSFANSYAYCSHGVTLIACVAHAGGSARRAAPRRLAQNRV